MKTILDTIGNTPLLQVNNLDTGRCKLFLKLENQNPGGSIKDRMALSIINEAEKNGLIKPGTTIIEATTGNTGMSLALISKMKGYKLIIVAPDKISREKINHLKALDTEVILTRSDVMIGHKDHYRDKAMQLSKEISGSYYVNQLENPGNPLAHEITTGPEIISQLGKMPDAVVCGVGSGGTLTGLTRFFKSQEAKVDMVLADPKGSILVDYVKTGRMSDPGIWHVEGIGKAFIPPGTDFSGVTRSYTISDQESMEASQMLLRKEGILAGSSSGTLLSAALRYCREQTEPKTVVSFVCDTGQKYLKHFYDPNWFLREGYGKSSSQITMADLLQTLTAGGNYPCVESSVSIFHAYNQMRQTGVECLGITGNDEFAGVTDINRIIRAIKFGMQAYTPVASCMAQNWTSVQKDDPIQRIRDILSIGNHPVLFDGDQFIGIVSPKDFLDHWRLQLK